jgi:hypothetical protein
MPRHHAMSGVEGIFVKNLTRHQFCVDALLVRVVAVKSISYAFRLLPR